MTAGPPSWARERFFTMIDERRRARSRALRAAQVVTLGLVLAAPGCYATHGTTATTDSGEPVAIDDAGHDAGLADAGFADAGFADAGPTDAGLADAGFCHPDTEDWWECCNDLGWDFDRGCMAWGPFVPPSDGEIA
jgi:hypothetical protein